jgi:hypothetical protein
MASGLALAAPNIIRANSGRKYRTALIGSGWWGTNIAQAALESGESKIVALCDVDSNQLKTSAAKLEKLSGDKPKQYKDYHARSLASADNHRGGKGRRARLRGKTDLPHDQGRPRDGQRCSCRGPGRSGGYASADIAAQRLRHEVPAPR